LSLEKTGREGTGSFFVFGGKQSVGSCPRARYWSVELLLGILTEAWGNGRRCVAVEKEGTRDARQEGWFCDFREVIDSAMPPQAKLVRLCLARFANEDRLCWPSIDTIASVLNLSRASVVRALKYLVDHGWVKRVPRPGNLNVRTTVYALTTPSGQEVKPETQPFLDEPIVGETNW